MVVGLLYWNRKDCDKLSFKQTEAVVVIVVRIKDALIVSLL